MIDYTIYEVNGLANLNIALLTDLHDRDYFEILEITRESNPDIICVCGDFLLNELIPEQSIRVYGFISTQKNVLSFLNACSRLCVTYVSFGNHEWILTGDDIKQIESTGVIVLDDSWERLPQHLGGEIFIGGLNSAFLNNFRFARELNHEYSFYHEGGTTCI